MTPAEYLAQKGWQYKQRGHWLELKRCPFCHGGQRKDLHTFAVHSVDGNYTCQRSSCGVQGSFLGLQENFGDRPEREYRPRELVTPKKQYVAPKTPLVTPSQKVTEYLRLRGFSPATIERRQIRADQQGNVVIPYYEDGKLVMLKFRYARKAKEGERKAWREEGGKPVLWGKDLCDPAAGPLVITFGEYDAMACDEVGIPNAVSVPSGDKDLTWIELDWEWLQKFPQIVLWPDEDEPDVKGERSGEKALHECARRLGIARVRVVKCGFKDANEMLHCLTKRYSRDWAVDTMRQEVEQAAFYPYDLVIRLCDVPDDPVIRDGIVSGLRALDRMTGGWRGGEITVIGGDNGSGKTTGVLNFAVEAVAQRQPVFLYSGEMRKSRIRYWTELVIAGPDPLLDRYSERTGRTYYEVDGRCLPLIKQWYGDYYYLYDVLGGTSEERLFEAAELAAMRYGCKLFVFDNLMMMTLDAGERDYLTRQAKFVQRCKEFAEQFDGHVLFIAHNRKPGDPHTPPTKASVEGTAKITNLVDNAGAFWRVPKTLREGELAGVDSLLCWFKTRDSGEESTIALVFDPRCKRFAQADSPESLRRDYAWSSQPVPQSWFEQEEVEV